MSELEFLKMLGLRIRKARRSLDLTQLQVGQRLGGNGSSYVCEIEKGKRNVKLHTIFKFQEVLGVQLIDIEKEPIT